MKLKQGVLTAFTISILLNISSANAVKRDPDCDVEKAAKGAAMNATIGFGGKCSPAETAKDMTKDAIKKDEKKSKKKKLKKKK